MSDAGYGHEKRLHARDIENVMESLTVLDVDVSRLGERLAAGSAQRVGSDAFICIIDITCCIIDCSRCSQDDIDIYSNPANILEGFAFRLREQADNADAPVFFMPESNMAEAFRAGHNSLRVPEGHVDAQLLGLAGDVLDPSALEQHGIAPTAPVVSLSPAQAAERAS